MRDRIDGVKAMSLKINFQTGWKISNIDSGQIITWSKRNLPSNIIFSEKKILPNKTVGGRVGFDVTGKQYYKQEFLLFP